MKNSFKKYSVLLFILFIIVSFIIGSMSERVKQLESMSKYAKVSNTETTVTNPTSVPIPTITLERNPLSDCGDEWNCRGLTADECQQAAICVEEKLLKNPLNVETHADSYSISFTNRDTKPWKDCNAIVFGSMASYVHGGLGDYGGAVEHDYVSSGTDIVQPGGTYQERWSNFTLNSGLRFGYSTGNPVGHGLQLQCSVDGKKRITRFQPNFLIFGK